MGRGRSKAGGYKEYKDTGEHIAGFKVIKSISGERNPLPRFSNSLNATYILKSAMGEYKSIGIYNKQRELVKEIDVTHSHTNRYKNGKKIKLLRGIAHVHNYRGGRNNNVRYMTRKEAKKYGEAVARMGEKNRQKNSG